MATPKKKVTPAPVESEKPSAEKCITADMVYLDKNIPINRKLAGLVERQLNKK